MITKIDITDATVAQKVLDIQIPSYLIETSLIDFNELPPLKDTVHTLQQCDETFYGYHLNEELCGIISFKIENGVMDIHRLAVHPAHFRKGIAKQLIDFIQIGEKGFDTIIVTTGSKNEPAVYFYQKCGFSITGEIQAAEHLFLTSFQKKSSQL